MSYQHDLISHLQQRPQPHALYAYKHAIQLSINYLIVESHTTVRYTQLKDTQESTVQGYGVDDVP